MYTNINIFLWRELFDMFWHIWKFNLKRKRCKPSNKIWIMYFTYKPKIELYPFM